MGTRLGSWLPAYRRRHLNLMLPVTLICAVVFAAAPPAGRQQLLALAVAVAVFGLPHGALDHLVGRRLLRPRWGSRWALGFAAGYLALAAAVLVAWWAMPRFMLAAFLLYSAWHFGAGDAAAGGGTRGWPRRLAALRGWLPIALPAVFHGAEVTRYFNWLLPADERLSVHLVETIATVAVTVALPLAVAGVLANRAAPSGARPCELGELGTLSLLFAAAPPFVSFLVYFCGWHSLRHLLELGEELDPADARRAASMLVRSAWPLTLVTVAGAYPAWLLLRGAGLDGDAALAQVLFIGLAALTVPHMVLGSLSDRQASGQRSQV